MKGEIFNRVRHNYGELGGKNQGMIAELVFVGTELLLGQILNTNAQFLSQKLSLLGVDNYFQVTVGDNPGRLAETLRQALGRADVVITSGGLGPTQDDLTRDIAAEVTGRPLALDTALAAELEGWFSRRGRRMSENNLRQCMVPQGATVLPNPNGTAPGLIVPAADGKAIVLLPGPPNELLPMFDNQVVPYLTGHMDGAPLMLVTRTLRFADIGESLLEDRLKDIVTEQDDPTVAPYAQLAEVHLRLATKAVDPAAGLARIAPLEARIRERVGRYLYGVDATTLEEALGNLLRERGLHLTAAESCTGGLLAKRITDVSGSSDYFLGGLVTYADAAKTALLGVPEALLTAHGAVSEPVAAAMATGALVRMGADVALSITGIAGPGGGTAAKPVGTVCLGRAARPGAGAGQPADGQPETRTLTLQLWGSRRDIRERSAQNALALARRFLLGQ